MTTSVHLVGSVGLDTAEEVMATVGQMLGPHLKRVPDGEPGGRRMWVAWQYPLFRSCTFLEIVESDPTPFRTGFARLKLVEGVEPDEIRFPELGYAREAWTSYQIFLDAKEAGDLPDHVRFQVSLPTPIAPCRFACTPETVAAIEPAYTKAMLREVERICATVPHNDLTIQWDICGELLIWDGRMERLPPFPDMAKLFGEMYKNLSQPIPPDVELGFHLCYGDVEAKHLIEPFDTTKLVEFANLIIDNTLRPIGYFHMPVPIDRDDDDYFQPLEGLRLPPETELYLGLVHAGDGAAGTKKRMAVARKYFAEFGIATECGMARARSPQLVQEILQVHVDVAADG